MKVPITSFLLGFSILSYATEFSPWYPNIFEVQPMIEILSLHSSQVASNHGNFHRHLNATFLRGSMSLAYYDWYGEGEVLLANDTHRDFGYDSCIGTFRYLITNDVPGDSFLSSTAGLSIISASRRALDDLSSFHHGKFEGLIHFSLGKEFSHDQDWDFRLWGTLGLGVADVGSPWGYCKLCAEKKYALNQQLAMFLNGLWGFGGDALSRKKHFHGYGPIAHRSLDVTTTYSYLFEEGLQATLKGSYRLYAHNFPKQAYSVSISLLYPFGL